MSIHRPSKAMKGLRMSNSNVEHRQIDSDGVSIAAQHWGGSGKEGVVLLLHGIGGNGLHFNALAPRLVDFLGPEVAVVSIDQRGHGDSGKPRWEYDVDFFALDAFRTWREFGGSELTLVGHSRGGWLGAYMASHWPDLVKRLVLVDPARTTFDGAGAADAFYSRIRALQGPFPSMDAAIAFAKEADTTATWNEERKAACAAGFETTPEGWVQGKMPRWVIDRLEETRMSPDRVTPWLDQVTARTLLFVATTSKPERVAQKEHYAQHIAGTRSVYLDGSHYLAHDCVDDVDKHIRELFA
jgi:pimeloyl-ACP methyl ester carboxylesterase